MEPNKHTTRNIEIDGMSGDACIHKVTNALKGLRNVSTQSVKVGSAHLNTDDEGCKSACNAISNAGFKAREHANASGQHTAAAVMEPKGAQQGTHNANDKHAAVEPQHTQGKTPAPAVVTT